MPSFQGPVDLVAGQPEFESRDCHPQTKGVVMRIVADR
jgi:hypothetical protein